MEIVIVLASTLTRTIGMDQFVDLQKLTVLNVAVKLNVST